MYPFILLQKLCADRDIPLPPLNTSDEAVATLAVQNELPTQEVKTNVGILRIRPAEGKEELLEVEKLMRDSAEEGRDFAVDEFNDNGFFAARLLRTADRVVAENASGEIIGAAVLGPSAYTRSPVSLLAQQYMAIKKKEHYQAVGNALLQYGMPLFKNQGYKGVLSDVYLTSHRMTDVYRSNFFTFRGSVPYAGAIKGDGPVPTNIVYYPF